MSATKETLERIARWRIENKERVLEHKRRYYRRNREKWTQWKKANSDKVKASYTKHATHHRARIRQWQKANPERVSESRRKSDSIHRQRLTESYVRKLIARHDGWELAKLVPQNFIQAKRAHIQLIRICQDRRTLKT